MRSWSCIGALIALVLLTGCAGKKIARDQLSAVKSVAIVGFGVEQRMPNTGGSVLEGMMAPKDQGMMPGLKAAKIAEPSPAARAMYDILQKELAKGAGWKVLAHDDLVKRPAYSDFFRDKTKQPQFRPMVSGSNVEMYIPENIVESFLLGSMSMDERRALIKKLGVDAIALVTVRVELYNGGGLKNLVGAGDLHPKAKLSFDLYNATQEDPIWRDLNADGEEGKGVEHFLGFANVDAVGKQSLQSVASAVQQLLIRYRE